MFRTLLGSLALAVAVSASGEMTVDPAKFDSPPAQYRPVVSLDEGSENQLSVEAARRVLLEEGAGAIVFSPEGDPERQRPEQNLSTSRPLGLQKEYSEGASPWVMKALPGEEGLASFVKEVMTTKKPPEERRETLGYLTPEWFDTVESVLQLAREQGSFATFYDEAGFPSGLADYTVPEQYYRKLLRREEVTVSAYQRYTTDLGNDDSVVALVAMDARTGERVDLMPLAENGQVDWVAPPGSWRVQKYVVMVADSSGSSVDYYGAVDYLDPEAVQWFIDKVYGGVYEGLSEYFGDPVNITFFDDTGIYPDEKTWHPAIAKRFEELTGQSAALYYPALWEDIGPETAAARVGFFKARAELLGEGLPKLITEWTSRHGVKSTGHSPGNYNIQPTDMQGDPFKFYAYTDIPMVDTIFGHGHGRDGFKLVSSVSSQRDLPVTAAEVFTAANSQRGYQRMIELFVRGINHFITGGRTATEAHGTPLEFNQWAGRTSLLLQGGRHVADLAVLYPIESLQAFYAFDDTRNTSALPAGKHVYHDADYLAVGEMLLSQLHRDFTFVHPDALGSDKLKVEGSDLVMQNDINRESYKALILPGGEVLSVAALRKIKAYFDAGGAVIATSLLPSRSAEFGGDEEVQSLVKAIFGENAYESEQPRSLKKRVNRNKQGGQAVFIPLPDPEQLALALSSMGLAPDVSFRNNPAPTAGNGLLGYLHKQKEGKEIYFFGNSSHADIDTVVTLRGRIENPQLWNPHNGEISPAQKVKYHKKSGGTVTEVELKLGPVSSLFVVGEGE